MVLIPTTRGETKEVGDFRPISVLNVSVKILTKVLANRRKNVLGDIINDHQSGFLKGRCILDSIASTQQVIQFSKRNGNSGYMLKPNFEKAYDTVEWGCILKIMQSWGFTPLWISWV